MSVRLATQVTQYQRLFHVVSRKREKEKYLVVCGCGPVKHHVFICNIILLASLGPYLKPNFLSEMEVASI